jgi:2-succinyl-5-enolpyruvyl-6-hydroxy-3-cyclohexene-1-carboxylate synthase
VNAWHAAVDVVGSCLKAGVREFVVCGGARNAAILDALARAEAAGLVRVWRHFEERSAGFFAMGRCMATAAPCAVVTTSGTAAAELLPAMIEAKYQARPLVAITADRPAQFRGTGAPQSIDQVGIFGDHAWRDGFSGWDGKQPLHLNVEMEEAFVAGDGTFAAEDCGEFSPLRERIDVAALARWLREEVYRGIVVVIGGLEADEREEVFHFCHALRAPVVAEASSGLREALHDLALADADRVLRNSPPGKVLRLGDVPSGRFWRDLEDLPEVSVWSACRSGLPGMARASQVTQGSLARLLPALGDIDEAGDALDYFPQVGSRRVVIDELLEAYPDSEPGLLRLLSNYAALGDGLFLGNSLPIREWDLFAQGERPLPSVRANRGANGIDGQISTWLGWSAETARSWAVVGDLTALYDLAGPFVLGQLPCEGRVLAVINNGGGKIFQRLPRLAEMSPQAAEWMVNPQEADLAGFAQLWGMDHLRIRTADDFDRFEEGPRTLLLELVPDEKQTKDFWAAWDRRGP